MLPAMTGALRLERAAMLRFCSSLSADEWSAASLAHGWRVQDVVAHIGAGCRAMFSPAMLTILRSADIERTNDLFVERRRHWSPADVLAAYTRWSGAVLGMDAVIGKSPVAGVSVPLAELGRFKLGLILAGAMTFDHHAHLRYDIAPALDRPAPVTDDRRMSLVLRWMFAVLCNQIRLTPFTDFTQPVGVSLSGPGAGDWVVSPEHGVRAGEGGTPETTVFARTTEFPEWATRRVDWRLRDVSIVGDRAYAERVLDQINVV